MVLVLGGMPICSRTKVRFENIAFSISSLRRLNSGLTMMGFSTQMMQLIQGVVFLIFGVAEFAEYEYVSEQLPDRLYVLCASTAVRF